MKKVLFSSKSAEFHFTLDPCCTDAAAKCKKHYTKADDGLSKDWSNEIVFCNPPYGKDLKLWVKKCHESSVGGNGSYVNPITN